MVLAWAFWMYFPLWDQLRTDLTICLPAKHISPVPVEGIRFPYLQVCPLWVLCFIFTYALAVWVFDPLGGHSPPQIKNYNSKDTHDTCPSALSKGPTRNQHQYLLSHICLLLRIMPAFLDVPIILTLLNPHSLTKRSLSLSDNMIRTNLGRLQKWLSRKENLHHKHKDLSSNHQDSHKMPGMVNGRTCL